MKSYRACLSYRNGGHPYDLVSATYPPRGAIRCTGHRVLGAAPDDFRALLASLPWKVFSLLPPSPSPPLCSLAATLCHR